MTHKNYFEFSAKDNFELGYLMGQAFAKEAQEAIIASREDNWTQRITKCCRLLEITKNYFPNYLSEIEGYAKGAQVNFLDLWTLNVESDAYPVDSAKCTNLITNSGKLIGHNEDADEPGCENNICVVKKTINKITSLEMYYYNTLGGNSVGVNSFGYVQSINTLFFTGSAVGVPKNVTARCLSDTRDPEKDINYVLSVPRASGYNHNISDNNGKIWNLELTSSEGFLSKPKSPFAHSNHCLNISTPFKDDYGTISRLIFFQENVKKQMSVDEIIALQENTGYGPNESVFNERTIGKMVIDFDSMTIRVWLLREKELGWISYPLDFLDI